MYSTPELLNSALKKLQQPGRSRLISSHGNVRSTKAVGNSLFYLERLKNQRLAALTADQTTQTFLESPLEDFMPPGVEPAGFERVFHQRNLQTIVERRLFAE
jgi:hypothetical protein